MARMDNPTWRAFIMQCTLEFAEEHGYEADVLARLRVERDEAMGALPDWQADILMRRG